jgi:hypothetical protein
MHDTQELVDRYVAMWNEPDAERRRQAISELWASDAVHKLEPPQETRETAATLRVNAVFEVRGHGALEERVTRAYEEFIEPGEFAFRAGGRAARVGDVVKLGWEMVKNDGGDVAAVGIDFLVLDADGRIRRDYQFIES